MSLNEFKRAREEYEALKSKDKLLSICKTKIRTTMIGAIDDIEKKMATLWADTSDVDLLKKMKQIFDEMRSSILDRGNNQIRNLESDFSDYNITWKRYSLVLPVLNKEDNNGSKKD